MTPKFLLHDVKEYLKLQYKFFQTFALQRFVDEIFQFEFFGVSANLRHTLHNELLLNTSYLYLQ